MKIKARSRSLVLAAFLILFLICISSTALAFTTQVSNSASGDTAEPYKFVTKWGSGGSEDGQFRNPEGVDVDSSGNVYVAEPGNSRIQKFDSNGMFITKWGSYGSKDEQFSLPDAIAVDSSGNVYVTDTVIHRIQKFDSHGKYLTQWGSLGSSNGQFNGPYDIAVDSSGNVYVADRNNHRIQKFDSNGMFITKWNSTRPGEGQYSYPQAIAVDSSGNVYVTDLSYHRIQKFDSNGNFITNWGSSGSGDGQFYPYDVAVDSSGNVYVAERHKHCIQKFDSNGTFITKLGYYGSEDGQITDPVGVTVDSSGNVYVLDFKYNRILKFAPETPEPSAPIYNLENGHYYNVFFAPGINWKDAKDAAQSLYYSGMKGHLATVTSQDENDFIVNNIDGDNCWLGGYQPNDTPDSMEPDGNWHWVTEEKWDYTNWPIGIPDNARNGQNWLALWSGKNWDDASIDDQAHIRGYIVEYEEQRLPVANFITNVTTGNVPLSVQFTDLSENVVEWNWNFGDGNTSPVQNPTHTYYEAGNYTIALKASNENGADSKVSTIAVFETVHPAESPVENATNVYAPVNVQIGNLSQNANEINWNIGSQHLSTNFSGNGQNFSAPVTVQIGNASQNATTINWNIYSV